MNIIIVIFKYNCKFILYLWILTYLFYVLVLLGSLYCKLVVQEHSPLTQERWINKFGNKISIALNFIGLMISWNKAYQHHNYKRRSFHILLQDTICYKSIYYYLLKETVSSHIQYASSVPKSFEWLNDDLCDVNESEKKNFKYYCIFNPISNEKLKYRDLQNCFEILFKEVTWKSLI